MFVCRVHHFKHVDAATKDKLLCAAHKCRQLGSDSHVGSARTGPGFRLIHRSVVKTARWPARRRGYGGNGDSQERGGSCLL